MSETAPARRAGPSRWVILAMIIVAGILNYMDRGVITVLKPVIARDLRWTDADYGRLASMFQLAAAAAYLVTGRLADRLGIKWANPVGVAAWSLAAMAHGLARTLPQFAVVRVALGASESMGTPSGIKTIASLFSPAQRSQAIGISNAAGNFGAILTPLFVPLLASAWGWRSAFMLVGAAGFVWVALWLALTRGLPAEQAAPATRAEDALTGGPILRDRRTWAVAIAKALSDQVWWLLLFWAPDFFHRVFGLGLNRLGPPLAVIYLCAAAGSAAAGFISTRLLRAGVGVGAVRKGSMLVCALLVLPAPLALHAHSVWTAVALIGLLLAAHQGFSVNLFSLIADIMPAAKVGRVTSFGSLCGNLAGMGIVWAAGELLTAGYGYGPLLDVAAVSYLLGLAWIQLLLPRLTKASD